MLKRPSEHRLTLEERIAVVVAIAIAVGIHLAILLGGSGIGRLVQLERKRERLMVVRRMDESAPVRDITVRIPDSRRLQVAEEPGTEGKAAGAPPKPEQKVSEHGTQPPPKAPTPAESEEDLEEALRKLEEAKSAEQLLEEQRAAEVGNNAVSVVTDLPSASFTLSGPAEYRGTGTFWIRRGAPAGTYRIAFDAVNGFSQPPPQTKQLTEQGQIVFVGKYKRSSELIVEANHPGAQFTIFRPDGRPLDMNRPGRMLLDDLPAGTYTAVFKDLPGYIKPAPVTSTLAPGGKLTFFGEYRKIAAGQGDGAAVAGASGPGTGARGAGSGAGGGYGRGSGGGTDKAPAKVASAAPEISLDRRVQMVVESYPRTGIEEDYDPIPYPEVIIGKSKFQQGWCQVYLVVSVSDSGEVTDVAIERPQQQDRSRFDALIKAVESAVRSWDYDRVKAEVHVDVRFYVE